MLCQFTFRNFKSYKDETVFDMQAESLPEFKETLLGNGRAGSVLPVSVLYGPNGGGKSNMLEALSCLIATVVKPIYDLGKNSIAYITQMSAPWAPFAFDGTSRSEPTEFEVYFRTDAHTYRYVLHLKNGEVIRESLHRKSLKGGQPALLFTRDGAKITPGRILGSVNTQVNEKMPYLTFLSINYKIDAIRDAQRWFESCLIVNYAESDMEKIIVMMDEEKFKKQIIRTFNDVDVEISDIRFDTEDHRIYFERNLNGEVYELPVESESYGTRKLFSVLPQVLIALCEGRLLIADELDAKLHPKLLRYIVGLFKDKRINTKGAQLLFTSHDLTTMKNTVFRRDEIWFAARNGELSSELYSLYDIRDENGEHVHNTMAYDKQYLKGRYGADPFLQQMLCEEDWK